MLSAVPVKQYDYIVVKKKKKKENTMAVWRYSSKYVISNVNQVDFDTNLLDVLLLLIAEI